MITEDRIRGKSDLLDDAPQTRVIQYVRSAVQSGELAGRLVPSDRMLAERLQVSRGTVRRAFDVLVKEGVLRRRGPKMRLIAAEMSNGNELLQRTVAILSATLDFSDFVGEIASGAMKHIRSSDLHALTLTPSVRLSDEIRDLCRNTGPLGILVPEFQNQGTELRKLVDELRNDGVRVVVHSGAPELAAYDRVMSDHEGGSYELTKWAIAQGRRRIVNVWSIPDNGYWYKLRQAGYERAMREAGLTAHEPIRMPGGPAVWSENRGERRVQFDDAVRGATGYLMDRLTGTEPADALLMATDRDTLIAAAVCRKLGRVPGQDVMICGFDNRLAQAGEREFESFIPQATVDKNFFAGGQEMVNLLLARSRGQLPAQPQCRVVPSRLVVLQERWK